MNICMLCRTREAKYQVTTDEGKANLCEDCLQWYRLLEANGEIDGLNDFFYMCDAVSNPLTAYIVRNEMTCPACGTSLNQLTKEYKFGCSKCYEVFSSKAQQYFEELGGQEYKGKYFGYENKNMPKKGRRLSEMTLEDMPLLLKELQTARDKNEVSRADAISKHIQQLKGERK